MHALNRTIATLSALFLLSYAIAGAQVQARSVTYNLDIPAQDLDTALQALALSSKHKLFYRSDLVQGKKSPALKGSYTEEAALNTLLAGSDLTYEVTANAVVFVREKGAEKAEVPTTGGRQADQDSAKEGKSDSSQEFRVAQVDQTNAGPQVSQGTTPIQLDEVVVTGTHIHGAQIAAQVLTLTQEQMRLSGQTNLGDVIRSLPQNFGGGQNPTVVQGAQSGVGNNNNANVSGGSALNLRGLGADATLTLLNGVRMPYDGISQGVDISVIPVAAIDRIEILLDGASAIYGSDAVGGVANVILKRDYNGAEMSVRYGGATEGGYDQEQYQAIGGTTWSTGGFLITGDFSHNSAVLAGQRDYLSNVVSPLTTVYPRSTQRSGLFSGHQSLDERLELTLDSFYTTRDQNLFIGSPTSNFPQTLQATVWGVSPALHFSLPGDWSGQLGGFTGRDDATLDQATLNPVSGAQLTRSAHCACSKANSADLGLEGALFSLPGGEARLSVGGGYRRNDYLSQIIAGTGKTVEGSDLSHYFYAETNLPFVSQSMGVPLVSSLSVNAAVRTEDYKSFGGTTTPKFGINWSVVEGFDLKGSWGKSYKVPELSQMLASPSTALYPNTFVAGVPAGSTVLFAGGGSPTLTPERANTVSAGFVVEPVWVPDFRLEASWFDIDYKDRVLQPVNPLATALSNPAFADFVAVHPTAQQQSALFAATGAPLGALTYNFAGRAYDPTKVFLLVNDLYANASQQRTHGVDLSALYGLDAWGGRVSLNGDANWLKSQRRVTALAPEQPVSGLIFFPAETRAQLGAAWRRGGLTLSAIGHYIDGVTDTNVTPKVQRASMTTFDLVLDDQMHLPIAGDLGLNLSALNVADRRPPYMHPIPAYSAPYDSTNYSALGRVLSLMVTKRF